MDGAGSFNRIFVLESRTSERQTWGQIIYFPFIFFMFGVIVGNKVEPITLVPKEDVLH